VPTLSLPALRKQIADRRLARLYLFLGDDLKLVDRMIDAVESVIDPADRAFAIDRFYAGEDAAEPVDIAAAARSMPMLGDRRLVMVMRAERLLKPKRASKGKEDVPDEAKTEDDEDAQALDTVALEEYIAAPVEFSTVVFVAIDVDRTRRFTKRLLDAAQVVEFRGLADAGSRDGRGGALEWLRDEIVRSGREIEPEASRLLITRSGGDISRLRGDVERLLLFTEGRKRITSDDVLEVSAEHQTVDDDWGVVNAIGNGDAARALVELGLRLDRGDSPHQMLGQLRWWVSNTLAQGSPERTKAAIEALLRTDLALKSSGGEDRVLLERLVVELTGKPVASQRGGWGGRR